MPYNQAANNTSTFFSFDMGTVHFIMFNTEPMLDSTKQDEVLT